MIKPHVSVIVPTKNSERTLEQCLISICQQTYAHIEIIVIDNHSIDTTQTIAKKYTDKVYTLGPERSTQRNFGVKKASGDYVAIIDSDMELSPAVIQQCVKSMKRTNIVGVIIPEESFGEGFWARCKKLERSFYVGVDWMEAARFFSRTLYAEVGGYDQTLVSGEDWDLSQRIGMHGKLIRIPAFIYHNEGRLYLRKTLSKKYYYAKHFAHYVSKASTINQSNVRQQTGLLQRYLLYFRQPTKLFRNPIIGLGMIGMKTAEFGWGFFGYMTGKLQSKTIRED